MNREETKAAAEVMMAYAEGKTIEIKSKDSEHWMIMTIDPNWQWDNCDYRIKPEPQYRPFANAEEVMEAIKEHGDWVKYDTYMDRIVGLAKESVSTVSTSLVYNNAFRKFTFADDTPFGKLEE